MANNGNKKEILTVDYQIFMGYMAMMLDFDNNGEQFRRDAPNEIKMKLEEATGKTVRWKNKNPKK
jgi:hypothetical protein